MRNFQWAKTLPNVAFHIVLRYNCVHISWQVLFWAGNQNNHLNFTPSLLLCKWQGRVEILMIILVSSPKQHLPSNMHTMYNMECYIRKSFGPLKITHLQSCKDGVKILLIILVSSTFFQFKIYEKLFFKKKFVPSYPDLEEHKLILQFDAVIATF